MNIKFSLPKAPSLAAATSMTGSMSRGIGSLTKKMTNVAVSAMRNDNKSDIKEAKQAMIDSTLYLLQDIALTSSSTHLGLITVFSAATLSPLINKGACFKWFRVQPDGQLTLLDYSSRPHYPPTIDDVGCKVMVQCEDVYEQHCAKYLEVTSLSIFPFISNIPFNNMFYLLITYISQTSSAIAVDPSIMEPIQTLIQTRAYKVLTYILTSITFLTLPLKPTSSNV